MNSRKVFFLCLLICIATHFLSAFDYKVLILHSSHKGYGASDTLDKGLSEGLQSAIYPDSRAEIFHFYLDSDRFDKAEDYWVPIVSDFYVDAHLNLILCIGDPAFRVASSFQWRLEQNIPLIFLGIDGALPENKALTKNKITGVITDFSGTYYQTIDLSLKLFPKTKRLLFIFDHRDESRNKYESILSFSQKFLKTGFTFVFEDDLELVKNIVADLSEGDVVFLLNRRWKSQENYIPLSQALGDIKEISRVPVFSFLEDGFDQSLSGGAFMRGRNHGLSAGHLLTSILQTGFIPSPIMVQGELFVDMDEIRKFSGNLKLVPSTVRKIEAEDKLSRSIKDHIWWIVFIVVISVACICILLISIFYLRSARNAIKQKELLLRSYLDNSPEPIFITNIKGNYTFVNQKACEISGYTKEELLKLDVASLWAPESRQAAFLAFQQVLTAGKVRDDFTFIKKDGTKYPMLVNAVLVGNNEPLAICRDLSQEKKSEAAILASLHEKEVLLRELYHRTKNNMAVINSLLELYASDIQIPQVSQVYRAMQKRIYTMALVHEKLYQSSNLSDIDLQEYVQDLLAWLGEGFQRDGLTIPVEKKCSLEPIRCSVDYAVPFGLVLTELVSNSYSHAFTKQMLTGEVSVTLQSSSNGYFNLFVKDNGQGIQREPSGEIPIKTGLETVYFLVRMQLHGQITLLNESGTVWHIQGRFIDKKTRIHA